MGIEIERKFLVDDDADRASLRPLRAWAIRQGYVTPPGSDPEVRVRHARPLVPGSALRDDPEPAEQPEVRRLTTKAATGDGGVAVSRVEVEVDLDAATFDELWAVTEGRRIEKVRIEYALDDERRSVATVDRFAGPLEGLRLAEVEFADDADARAFVVPSFLREEVSGDRRYRNAALAGTDRPPVPGGDEADAPEAPAAGAGSVPDAARPGPAAAPGSPETTPAPKGGAATYRIAGDEPLGDGLRRAARDQLEGAVRALEDAFAQDPGKAIHDARKRLKRTRALLRLARPALGRKVARRENAALRTAAATLSAARDADVVLQTVDALRERYAGQLPAATFDAVRAAIAGPAGPGTVPSVDEALDGIRSVLGRIDAWPLADATAADVLAGAGVAYAAGRAQLPGSEDRPTAEQLHEWRGRVKDLWYHGLLLQEAWAPVLQPQAEEAHLLSELLGDDHDLAVLRDRLTGAPIDDPGADVDGLLALIDRRREEQLAAALDLGRRVYVETPKAHARRLGRLVGVWRGTPTG